jgi:hypothetical protein
MQLLSTTGATVFTLVPRFQFASKHPTYDLEAATVEECRVVRAKQTLSHATEVTLGELVGAKDQSSDSVPDKWLCFATFITWYEDNCATRLTAEVGRPLSPGLEGGYGNEQFGQPFGAAQSPPFGGLQQAPAVPQLLYDPQQQQQQQQFGSVPFGGVANFEAARPTSPRDQFPRPLPGGPPPIAANAAMGGGAPMVRTGCTCGVFV